jgi:hypothetical protein|tara:strand:+ start:82 stop:420 length:339 start_codon:yes stop_codon:yes gene_type:complete
MSNETLQSISFSKRKFFLFHPYSGALIIAMDWVFFGMEAGTLGLSIPVMSLLAFATTLLGVFTIQIKLSKDNWAIALAKGVLVGFVAGIPTPIAGTFIGALILALSGLSTKK